MTPKEKAFTWYFNQCNITDKDIVKDAVKRCNGLYAQMIDIALEEQAKQPVFLITKLALKSQAKEIIKIIRQHHDDTESGGDIVFVDKLVNKIILEYL